MNEPVASLVSVLAGALGGLAVGVERQWSGHASGPEARFAGVRTFTLLGGLAALAGQLWSAGFAALAVVLLAGATALVVLAYAAASRRDVEGTTEVAALVVLAAGVMAGVERFTAASGIIAVTCLILVEKTRLHALVARLDDIELRAAARFAVMAVVILPLLPQGPYGPFGGVRPREVWAIALLFSGLSFAGYIARRAVGPRRGYLVAGLLGGVISSTSVALAFSRTSRQERDIALPLALGVVAASAVMYPRMLLATAVLGPPVALALLPYLLPPLLVAALVVAFGLRRAPTPATKVAAAANPLQVAAALQMAVLFQFVLLAVAAAHARFGDLGVLLSGAVLGLADVDALTISMARSSAEGLQAATAAQAIAIGALSNTLVKFAVVAFVGSASFRRVALAGLAAMGITAAATLWLVR